MINLKFFTKSYLTMAALSMCIGSAYAQATHTVHAVVVTPPAGPNAPCVVKLSIAPGDVDISQYSIKIGYNNALGTLNSVQDLTGQEASSGAQYSLGSSEFTLNGVSYANVFRTLIVTTISDFMTPTDLVQLNFTTSNTYNDPQNRFGVFIDQYDSILGPGGFQDENFADILVTYDSNEVPPASVEDWNLY